MTTIINLYDKYILTSNIDIPHKIPYYNNTGDVFNTELFYKVSYNNNINIFKLNKIISSKNNYFNIPYTYLIDYLIKDYTNNYILTVPNKVNKYEIKLLTEINNNVIPVYEYIIDAAVYGEWLLINNEEYNNDINLIYYDRYNTYKVNVSIKKFNIICNNVTTINYGTDWLMNELTMFIYKNSNIPESKWNDYINKNDTLLYEFLTWDFDNPFEYTFENDEDKTITFNITLDDFKLHISNYLSFFKDCIVRTVDIFKNLFTDFYDVNSFSVIDHAKYLIKDSLKCDYVYLNYNKREHKIIAVKNEYICNELKHGYISNRFFYNGDDQDIQHKINYVNDYHNILDNLLDIINSNKYLKHIFSTLMKDNILYLNSLYQMDNYVKQYYKYFNKYKYYVDILISLYYNYIDYYNYLFTVDNITIKYYGNDLIMFTMNSNDDNFVIPEELINCKDIFDFVTEYFNNINNFNKIIVSNMELEYELNQLKSGRKRTLITDVKIINDEELKRYLLSNYDNYIDSLNYLLTCNNIYYNDNTIFNPYGNLTDINDYFNNKFMVIPAYYYDDKINKNYIYEFIIDAFSYFYVNTSAIDITLIYNNYKITATKNNNIITFSNLEKGNFTNVTVINRLYKEFNECFYNLSFPKKYSKEYVLIGTGKTKLLQNKYKNIFFYYK